jgi:hypothetical protein
LRTGVTRAGVQANTVTTGTAVDFNLACVRLEACSGVFSGDTALNGKSTAVDRVLGKAELGEGDTASDLDLSSDNVDASDLL